MNGFEHLPAQWREAIEAFLAGLWERSGSDETVASYHLQLRQFYRDPERHPATYSRADVREFLDRKSVGNRGKGQPVAPATRNARLCVLISWYRFASAWSVPGTDIMLFTGVPPTTGFAYGKPEQRYRALSEEEMEAFFAAIPDTPVGRRDRSLFICFFALARRRSELIALRWGDIQESIIVDEKGNRRAGWTYKFRGKGKKRLEDQQEMPDFAMAAILVYLESAGRLDSMSASSYIWTSTHPGQGRKDGATDVPLNPDYCNLQFRHYCRIAGIEDREGLSLHSWRHSSALHRFALGANVLEIKALLRHSSLATTDVYLRQLTGQSDSSAQLLRNRFSFLRVQ